MRVCVVGLGVIGSIYGSVLAAAGNTVIHYVRPGAAGLLRGVLRSICSTRVERLRPNP